MQIHTHEDEVRCDESESGSYQCYHGQSLSTLRCITHVKEFVIIYHHTTLTSLRHRRESCPKLKLILEIKSIKYPFTQNQCSVSKQKIQESQN